MVYPSDGLNFETTPYLLWENPTGGSVDPQVLLTQDLDSGNPEAETRTLINNLNDASSFGGTDIQIEIGSQDPQPESFWQGIWREYSITPHEIMVTARAICFLILLSICGSEEELVAFDAGL